MSRELTRREFLQIATLVGAYMILTGCGSEPIPTPIDAPIPIPPGPTPTFTRRAQLQQAPIQNATLIGAEVCSHSGEFSPAVTGRAESAAGPHSPRRQYYSNHAWPRLRTSSASAR